MLFWIMLLSIANAEDVNETSTPLPTPEGQKATTIKYTARGIEIGIHCLCYGGLVIAVIVLVVKLYNKSVFANKEETIVSIAQGIDSKLIDKITERVDEDDKAFFKKMRAMITHRKLNNKKGKGIEQCFASCCVGDPDEYFNAAVREYIADWEKRYHTNPEFIQIILDNINKNQVEPPKSTNKLGAQRSKPSDVSDDYIIPT